MYNSILLFGLGNIQIYAWPESVISVGKLQIGGVRLLGVLDLFMVELSSN
jgi:hypothetical protein